MARSRLMIIPLQSTPRAWQPLTPRGVAAFAGAKLARLLTVQFVFAALTAATVVWFLHTGWFPIVRESIRQLPSRGEIRSGHLNWAGPSPQALGAGNFLAIAVDLKHEGAVRSPAHVQIEFAREDVRIFSLFGYIEVGYPKHLTLPFNRPELEPWWGAWEPPILWMAGGVVIVGMMAVWALLATLYFEWVWLAGFFANRNLDGPASWKLAGAALMPGALLMDAGIAGYGLGVFDPVKLLVIAGAHLAAGWAYLLVSPFLVPKLPSGAGGKRNPFAFHARGKSRER